MFTQFKNIDTAFSHIKRFSIGFLFCCTVISVMVVWKSFSWARESQEKIYVLAGGKAFEVFASDRKDNVAVELRDHISMFHYWFFTLDPDEKVIQAHMAKALNLADESGRRAYEDLKERGFYNNMISANISQEITVDSIQLDLEVYPFLFRCYATQKLIRSSSTVFRKLLTQGEVRNVSRSDNNAHGFLIQRWETVDNADSAQLVKP